MKQSVRVFKFGGTSVGSGERIRQVATIIAQAVHEMSDTTAEQAFPVVVVSAMSGITDQLLRIARHACNGQLTECEQELHALRQRHLEAADIVVREGERRGALRSELEDGLRMLREDVLALHRAVQEGRDNALPTAAVAAWGERLSLRLVAAAVNDMGVEAAAVRQEVIITTHPQTDPAQPFGVVVGANPLNKETRDNAHTLIHPLVKKGIVPVAAGFIGRTITGYVTTLGRNGSDYSATVIGAALDCVEVSIYTDVNGVLTADPRKIANARLLTHLSYAEAARLSWFGAKVLHPRTLIPIAHRNIPVRVRNTFHPQNRGTVIGPADRQSGARAITIRRNLALVTMESTDMFGAPENAGQVFALAARAGAAPVAICSSSGHHLSFVIEEAAVDSVVAIMQQDMGDWIVSCRRGLAACACIGSGFIADPASPARSVTALAHERIQLITQGSSELGITLIVHDRDSERALRCLHRDLIAPVIPLIRHTRTVRERNIEANGRRDGRVVAKK